MNRVIFGILAAAIIIPAILIGQIVRLLTTNHKIQVFALVLSVAMLTGCAAIIEQPARACHNAAMTVEAMTECNRLYPQHKGTITDIISQPLGTLESIIQHKGHNHQ